MLEKKGEYERIGKELSAGITMSKKLIELSIAREEYEAAKTLMFKYETGELKCPFERQLARIQKFIDGGLDEIVSRIEAQINLDKSSPKACFHVLADSFRDELRRILIEAEARLLGESLGEASDE